MSSRVRKCKECGSTGSSMVFHEHHKLPIRLGGTEDSDNKIVLCPTCHSLNHFMLYKVHGDERDLIAARGLAGFINKEEIVASLRQLGLLRGRERVKELWDTEEWRKCRLPQVLSLQKSNQDRLKELRSDEEWNKAWLAKVNENLKKAQKKNRENPSELLKENWRQLSERSKEAQSKLRAESPEWRERELKNQLLASKKGVDRRKWLKENCPEYQDKMKKVVEQRAKRNSNSYWVNNGEKSRRIPKGEPIPDGYELGKTDKRKQKPLTNGN